MARRSRTHHRKQSFQIPLAVVGGFAPLAVMTYARRAEGFAGMADEVVARVSGYKLQDKKWYPSLMISGLAPIIGGLLLHKLASRFGVNRMLAKSGIPFIRI